MPQACAHPTSPTSTTTDEYPCEREPHYTSDDARSPSAAVTQQEEDMPLPALCRFETKDDESRYEWQPRCKQPQCNSNDAPPPSAAATQQEEDVPLPALCRFKTSKDEGRYEWQPRCMQPHCTYNDAPPPSAAATQQEEDVSLPALCRFETREDERRYEWQPQLSEGSTASGTETYLEETAAEERGGHVGDRLQVRLSGSSDSATKNLKRFYNAASNCVEVVWTIPEKKLSIKDRAFNSPDFEIWEGGTFRLTLRSCSDNVKGGLHGSRGVGRVELKFEGGTEFAGKVHWRVAVGQNKELPFEGLDHDFATRPQSVLQQEKNFLGAVTRGSLLLHLEARI